MLVPSVSWCLGGSNPTTSRKEPRRHHLASLDKPMLAQGTENRGDFIVFEALRKVESFDRRSESLSTSDDVHISTRLIRGDQRPSGIRELAWALRQPELLANDIRA